MWLAQADFGCSTLFDGMSSAPDGQGKMLGSVPWMAPEGAALLPVSLACADVAWGGSAFQ